ncbi:MAG TPA: cytochrome d ubiquinol oxidase subunit II [Acidimicrobiales bacterium]|nr:cytochrome d ubiquinol oxidase subunit II [Acidimicrobiales bacterium]
MSTVVACILFLAVIVYSIFGGADFGAGIWDLLAGGARRGRRPREVIDRSIGPVWEANHVWLIFVFVVLWTAFPTAYASITLTLFVPLAFAALGIVLRGASFAFRHAVYRTEEQRVYGAFFALGSLLVPFAFGCVAGAIATGRVPAGGKAGDPWSSWVNPTSLLGGVLAVVAVAYLSSVFLVFDAGRIADAEMVEYFRRRAVVAAVVAGVVALAGIAILHADANDLFDELTARALPLVIVSAVGGIASLVLLLRESHRFARVAAVGAVGGIIAAWGVAQWPYVVPQTMTVDATAAPSGTLAATVVVFVLACTFILPSIGFLYWLDQQDALPEEGGDDGIDLAVAPGTDPGASGR